MKTILWTQNEDPVIPSTIMVNGIRISDSDEKQKAFDELMNKGKRVKFSSRHRERLHQKNAKISKQLNYSMPSEGGIYIQGCFTDLDTAGRRMPYMFYTSESSDMSEAIEILERQSSQLNRECEKSEIEELLNAVRKQKKKINLLASLAIVLIVILIILIIRM